MSDSEAESTVADAPGQPSYKSGTPMSARQEPDESRETPTTHPTNVARRSSSRKLVGEFLPAIFLVASSCILFFGLWSNRHALLDQPLWPHDAVVQVALLVGAYVAICVALLALPAFQARVAATLSWRCTSSQWQAPVPSLPHCWSVSGVSRWVTCWYAGSMRTWAGVSECSYPS